MEWLIVLGIVVLLGLFKILGQLADMMFPSKPDLGMSSKDIGKIVDNMWDEWKGD